MAQIMHLQKFYLISELTFENVFTGGLVEPRVILHLTCSFMVFTAAVVRSCDECESRMLDEIWCLFRCKPGHKLDHLLLQIGTFWPLLACCLFPTILKKKKSTIKVSALFCELLTACSKVSLPVLGRWAAFPSFPFPVMFAEWLRRLVPEWRYLHSVVVFERHSKRTCGKIFRRPLFTDHNFQLFFFPVRGIYPSLRSLQFASC